jgi:ribosomal protein S18 acetylase RimI-like enzyme
MECQGEDLLGGLGGTAMTHPDYRGRGLYSRLYNRAFERMVEMGVSMFYAFPDAHRSAHRLLVRQLGLVDVHEVPRFSLSLGDRRPMTEDGGNAHVEELARFDARFDRLWSRAQNRYVVAVKRDSRYLNWRFSLKPGEQYRIFGYIDGADLLGYMVLKTYGCDLQIVDMLTVSDSDSGVGLVARAARLAQAEGLESVSMWLNPADPLHTGLERLGFQPCAPVVYFGVRVLTGATADHPAYDFRNWHLMMSDSDVY